MAAKRFAGFDVDLAFVGHEIGRLIDADVKMLFDILCGDVRNVLGANFAVALYQRHNGVLLWLRLAIVDVLLFAADVGFIALDNFVAAADRAAFVLGWRHRFANAHLKEPCAFVLKAKHPAELMRAHAFLGSRHQSEGEKPLRQRDMAALHDGFGADRELLAAFAAMVIAGCWLRDRFLLRGLAHHRFSGEGLHGLLLLAEGANSAGWPALLFKVLAGFVFVAKDLIRDVKHGLIPVDIFIGDYGYAVKYIIPDFIATVNARYARIGEIFQKQRTAASVNRYKRKHFVVRSNSEAIAAARITQACKIAERGHHEQALKILDDLRITSPEYFEIYRAAAFMKLEAGDLAGARESYETAISIDPDQPQLFFWYAGFVMRHLDNALASSLFSRARELDPESSAVLREAARNELILPDFDRAQSLIDKAFDLDIPSHKETVILYDLQSQLFIRKARSLADAGDYLGSIETLDSLIEFIEDLDGTYIGSHFR
jgi:hypothetical protein